jgi:preprotein translocase subunit SecF
MNKKLIVGILVVLITSAMFSQTNKKLIDTGSVANQFDYLIKESSRYQDYKVIKINWIEQLKTNMLDSLKADKIKLKENYNTILAQQATIDSLKNNTNKLQQTLTTLENEKENVSFLGVSLSKSMFKTTVYLIIVALGLLLALFIFKFKQSNTITLQAKQNLKELESEFEEHRKVAIEREQKVRRQLQDEINKNKKDS